MNKQRKHPSQAVILAELMRLSQKAPGEVSRDYFRVNGRYGDKWNLYWPTFKSFLAAATDDNDLYYEALALLVSPKSRRK
jgi:hypothetical protein